VVRALRVTAVALITAGVVVLADVGITLAWTEPVSSIYGLLQQAALDDELEDLEDSFPGASGPTQAELRRDAERLARQLKADVRQGEAIGRLEIPEIDASFTMIEGTDVASLRRGPGHYSATGLPGSGTTVGVAGHRTTYLAPFRRIDQLEGGDEITIEMPYATLTYAVDRARVVEPTEVDVVKKRERERLVLTTCHPVYSAAQRYVVLADLESVESPD
jgi:sortase A